MTYLITKPFTAVYLVDEIKIPEELYVFCKTTSSSVTTKTTITTTTTTTTITLTTTSDNYEHPYNKWLDNFVVAFITVISGNSDHVCLVALQVPQRYGLVVHSCFHIQNITSGNNSHSLLNCNNVTLTVHTKLWM